MSQGDTERRIYDALVALLHRGTKDSFVLIEEPKSGKFVQFGKGRRLCMDVPCVELNGAETDRAYQFFRKLGEEHPREYDAPDPNTGQVRHGAAFYHDFGHDAQAAAAAALALFLRVFGRAPDVELSIVESEDDDECAEGEEEDEEGDEGLAKNPDQLEGSPTVKDQFTPETLSNESLKEVFDAAMMDTAVDGDGDLVVHDQYPVLVTVGPNGCIRFASVFGLREHSDPAMRFELVNRINGKRIIIRASVHEDDILLIDWYLPTRGGIGKKTVVLALRKFEELIASIGEEDTDDIIT